MPVPTSTMTVSSSSSSSTPSSSSSAATSSVPTLPPLTPVAISLSSCRFSSWYPSLKKVSPKATILDVAAIQPDFFEWLEEDGLILPRGSGAGVVGGEEEEDDDVGEGDHDQDDTASSTSSSSSSSSSTSEDIQPRDFSALDERIRQIIEKYDGEVFPKLDWSAPRDAAWILPGQSLKCTTPADVYLLLKSSDFVGKDLLQRDEMNFKAFPHRDQLRSEIVDQLDTLSLSTAPEHPTTAVPGIPSSPSNFQLNLILKRHFGVTPSHEFRCFVRAGQFVAICQRDGTYYDFLQAREISRDVRLKLLNFWQQNLKSCIPQQGSDAIDGGEKRVLQDYVWDAYFTRDRSRVFLMDVNPYLPRTDALSWDWEELERLAGKAWDIAHGQDSRRANDGQAMGGAENESGEVEDEGEDEDTGSSSSESEDDDGQQVDPRGDPFIRIYTDGRPPTTHYRPWSPSSNPAPTPISSSSSSSTTSSPEGTTTPTRVRGSDVRDGPSRRHRLLPPLRLLTSQAQSTQSFPTYASNMMPRDVVDVSDGRGIEEFARAWKGEVDLAKEEDKE